MGRRRAHQGPAGGAPYGRDHARAAHRPRLRRVVGKSVWAHHGVSLCARQSAWRHGHPHRVGDPRARRTTGNAEYTALRRHPGAGRGNLLRRRPSGLSRFSLVLKEGGAEPGVLKVVVLRRLVQLMLGEPVKFGSAHSSQLGPGVPKHVGGWPTGTWYRVPSSIAAIGFLRPEAVIFLVRQSFEALKELLGQPRPRLRGQLE